MTATAGRIKHHNFPGKFTEAELGRIAARCRLAPMTPEVVAIHLGYHIPRNRGGLEGKPTAAFLAKVEAALVPHLEALGLELHEELGKSASSKKQKQLVDRYVDFRQPRTKPAPFAPRGGAECVVTVDPSMATWKPKLGTRAYQRRSRRPKFTGGDAA